MSRSRSLLLVGALVAGALIPAAAAGAAPSDKANDRARAEHERIVAYWTPERMKAAKPRDFVRQADGSFVLATPRAKPEGNKGKPSGGGGGDTSTTSVTGGSWGNGGAVSRRTGKVYFGMKDEQGKPATYMCSGSLVADGKPGSSIVLTAAHCAYDVDFKEFATNWMFIPDFDAEPSGCGVLGCYTSTALHVHSGYANATSFGAATPYDYAFAVVNPPEGSQAADNVVGSYELDLGVAKGNVLSAFGFPAAAPYVYPGLDLSYCSGSIGQDRLNGNRTWSMKCDMTGGSSGGPWLKGLDLETGNDGKVGSLNSYGYGGKPTMYGPKFNGETQAVYAAAMAAGTGNRIV